jgi:pimeloyl-ACP methyl ester carboxylesterase
MKAATRTIVLIHGMWGHAGIVEPLRDQLTSVGYKVLTPVLPGHQPEQPEETRDLGDRSLADYAAYINRYLDTVDSDPAPILVGHSMGGLITQMVAATRPTGPIVLLNSAQPAGINIIYPSSARATLNVLLTPGFWHKPHRPSYRRARYGLFNRIPEAHARRIHRQLVPESGRAYAELVFWFLDPRRVTRVDRGKINVPILIITGSEDRIIPPRVARQIAQYYSSTTFVCYPGHGHCPFAEPGGEKIAGDMDRWLKEQR